MAAIKKGLGQGINALFSESAIDSVLNPKSEDFVEIDINKIEPNDAQPRKFFDNEALQELAESIKHHGIIQPIIVNKIDDYYQIVAGERRWRAARIAKLDKIPAIIKNYSSFETIQIALIENIQRSDLNAIEEADIYKRLQEDFGMTQEDISDKIGRSRSSVANTLRLLSLDERVKEMIKTGRLSSGTARPLAAVKNAELQFKLAVIISENDLNARQAEELVKTETGKAQNENRLKVFKPAEYKKAETDLSSFFGTKVNIKANKNGKGRIELAYSSIDDLNRLIDLMKS